MRLSNREGGALQVNATPGYRQEQAGEPANREGHDEAKGEQHRRCQADAAPPKSGQPRENNGCGRRGHH